MSYGSGFLKDRIKILSRKKAETSQFGIDGNGIEWEDCGCVWANVSWAKGTQALNSGAYDAYSEVVVRMRWQEAMCHGFTSRSRIVYEDMTYQVVPTTVHPDKRENTLQFNAQAIINDQQ